MRYYYLKIKLQLMFPAPWEQEHVLDMKGIDSYIPVVLSCFDYKMLSPAPGYIFPQAA